ncbi:MAG: hypothetical protein VX916_06015 [Planctomycetota bacterium]|nr:hypothetical protein [Planctomycetota bacterium]
MPSLLLPLLLAALPLAEESADPDFDIVFAVPAEMRLTSAAELAQMIGQPETKNISRAEAAGAPISHNFLWVDRSGKGRAIHVLLTDEPPFRSPQEFLQATGSTNQEPVEVPPPAGPGLMVENTFAAAQGRVMRVRTMLLMDWGNRRACLIKLQASDADWHQASPLFDAFVNGLRWERAPLQPGAGGPSGQPLGLPPGTAILSEETDLAAWTTLPVMGSLLLAGIILLGLAFGGRSAG